MFIYKNLIQLIIQQIVASPPPSHFSGDVINGHAQIELYFKQGFHFISFLKSVLWKGGGGAGPPNPPWLRR